MAAEGSNPQGALGNCGWCEEPAVARILLKPGQSTQTAPVCGFHESHFAQTTGDEGAGADHKTCPQCAEEVKAAAQVCRFCQFSFVRTVSQADIDAARMRSLPPVAVPQAERSHAGLFLVSPMAWAIKKTWNGKPKRW
jgi:Uncharacterised protein family UPF0547